MTPSPPSAASSSADEAEQLAEDLVVVLAERRRRRCGSSGRRRRPGTAATGAARTPDHRVVDVLVVAPGDVLRVLRRRAGVDRRRRRDPRRQEQVDGLVEVGVGRPRGQRLVEAVVLRAATGVGAQLGVGRPGRAARSRRRAPATARRSPPTPRATARARRSAYTPCGAAHGLRLPSRATARCRTRSTR